jgi:hypothetical protein
MCRSKTHNELQLKTRRFAHLNICFGFPLPEIRIEEIGTFAECIVCASSTRLYLILRKRSEMKPIGDGGKKRQYLSERSRSGICANPRRLCLVPRLLCFCPRFGVAVNVAGASPPSLPPRSSPRFFRASPRRSTTQDSAVCAFSCRAMRSKHAGVRTTAMKCSINCMRTKCTGNERKVGSDRARPGRASISPSLGGLTSLHDSHTASSNLASDR